MNTKFFGTVVKCKKFKKKRFFRCPDPPTMNACCKLKEDKNWIIIRYSFQVRDCTIDLRCLIVIDT